MAIGGSGRSARSRYSLNKMLVDWLVAWLSEEFDRLGTVKRTATKHLPYG